MNNYICLDSNVIIKFLTWEDGSAEAIKLMEKIVTNNQTILMPEFAWVEIGSILKKKVKQKDISLEESKEIWKAFCEFEIIEYVPGNDIMDTAWRISNEENLSTLYDAAFLATSEVYSSENDPCEFWTADERLANSVLPNKKYVKYLKDFK